MENRLGRVIREKRKMLGISQDRLCALLVMQLRDVLTPTQYRRFWMYYVDSLTEKEIARIEGISQQQVSKSVKAAKDKAIKKFSKR